MHKFFLVIVLGILFIPLSAFAKDTDNDGLFDEIEVLIGSDVNKKDTDGDGYSDEEELKNSFSPTSSSKDKINKLIEIDIKTQNLNYYFNNVKLLSYKVSTGKNNSTPRGEYKIYNKHPKAWSRLAKLWMPYWMAFTANGKYGIHELPVWPGGKREGEDHLGTPVSSGCIRLGINSAKLVYEWTDVGTKVIIK